MTLLELLVTASMILVIASVAMPLSRMSERRAKEIELRQVLREMRTAIDRFKIDWDNQRISHSASDTANVETGYPLDLEALVKGAPSKGPSQKILRYLRRVPIDPLTRSPEWGTRCYEDESDSSISCGRDVYDVYSLSEESALDGTKYRDW